MTVVCFVELWDFFARLNDCVFCVMCVFADMGRHKLVQYLGETASGEGTSTNPKHLTTEDRSLRASCLNAAVVNVMTLQRRDHYLISQTIVVVSRPLDVFHTHHIRSCRSAEECQSWLIKMVTGGFVEHLCEFAKQTLDRSALVDAGLQLPRVLEDYKSDDIEGSTVIDDELADIFGQASFSYIVEKCRRSLWMLSWPVRILKILSGSDGDKLETQQLFKLDYDLSEEFRALGGKSPTEKQLMQRHLFNTTAVRQLVAAFMETGFVVTDDIAALAKKRPIL